MELTGFLSNYWFWFILAGANTVAFFAGYFTGKDTSSKVVKL